MKEYENVIVTECVEDHTKLILDHGGGVAIERKDGDKVYKVGHIDCGDNTFKSEHREQLLLAGVEGYWKGKVVVRGWK